MSPSVQIDALIERDRKLREALGRAGFGVMETSGDWSIHCTTEAAKRAEEVEGRLVAENLELLALLTQPLWLVWSNEHRAWWGPNWSQYYWSIEAAGRYTLEGALEICKARGVERGDGINPPELVQPSPEWLAARTAVVAKVEGRQ